VLARQIQAVVSLNVLVPLGIHRRVRGLWREPINSVSRARSGTLLRGAALIGFGRSDPPSGDCFTIAGTRLPIVASISLMQMAAGH